MRVQRLDVGIGDMGMGMGMKNMDVDGDMDMMDKANVFRGELKLSMDSAGRFEKHLPLLNLQSFDSTISGLE